VDATAAGTRVTLSADAEASSLTLYDGVVFNLHGHRMELQELTVDGIRFGGGQYAAADLPAEVTDGPAGIGRIIVVARGTVFMIR
jgi:hypothetical protein